MLSQGEQRNMRQFWTRDDCKQDFCQASHSAAKCILSFVECTKDVGWGCCWRTVG